VILYVDSSNLVKLYLDEDDSRQIEESVAIADEIACSRLGLVEVHAALARAPKGHRITDQDYDRSVVDFTLEWREVLKISVTNRLLLTASTLAAKHGLRGYDAVHLSSAIALRNNSVDEVRISARDDDIRGAAIREGFLVQ
jgi:predicted nucleic acid-binding protein